MNIKLNVGVGRCRKCGKIIDVGQSIPRECAQSEVTAPYPAKRGMEVVANGEHGKIIGSHGQYLRVKTDMRKKPLLFHPTWHMRYLTEEGEQLFIAGSRH